MAGKSYNVAASTTLLAVAVRRTPRGEREITWASLSREVVDLIAEADPATEVAFTYSADTVAALAIIRIEVTGERPAARQLAGELRGLLDPFFRIVTTTQMDFQPAKRRMAVVPLAFAPESADPIGFSHLPGPRGRTILSHGTSAGIDDLTATILAVPELRYRVTITPADANAGDISRQSQRLLEERPDIARDTFTTLRALGRPVHVRATLEMTSEAPIPLRARAAVRGWFDGVQLDEVSGDHPAVDPPQVTTASLASALLRLPTFDDQTWHGFAAETWRAVPVVVSDPEVPSGMRVRLGTAQDALGRPRDVHLGEQDLLRHVHLLGQTGTGKSTLLAAVAHAVIEQGYGLLVLDPHAALVDRIAEELPASAEARTWLIRPGVVDEPVRLNPLAISRADQIATVVQDLSEIFYALFDPHHQGIVGPRFEQILRSALRSLVELFGDRASLADVPRVLADPRTGAALARAISDPDLKEFWSVQLRIRADNLADITSWFSSKFDAFLGTPQMRSLLETGADSFDPATAMDESRVILLDLNRARLGLVGSRMAGLLYLTRFWTAAFDRSNRRPFIILADEAHAFTATALPAIAAEGRKFGLGLVVAHQHPEQLDDRLLDALDGNAGTTIALRSGRDAAVSLIHRLQPEFDVDDLAELPDLTAAVVSTRHAQHPQPFTLTIDHNDRIGPRTPESQERVNRVAARSVTDLVDPWRLAHRLDLDRLREPAPTPAGPPQPDIDPGFLDDWLTQRRAKTDAAPQGTAQAALDQPDAQVEWTDHGYQLQGTAQAALDQPDSRPASQPTRPTV